MGRNPHEIEDVTTELTSATRLRNAVLRRARHDPQSKDYQLVISWDPGVRTGVAVIDRGGKILFTATYDNVDNATIVALKRRYPGASACIEEPPSHNRMNRGITDSVEHDLRRHFPHAVWIKPATWKGHPAAKVKLHGKPTQHEKDAAGMGRVAVKMGLV